MNTLALVLLSLTASPLEAVAQQPLPPEAQTVVSAVHHAATRSDPGELPVDEPDFNSSSVLTAESRRAYDMRTDPEALHEPAAVTRTSCVRAVRARYHRVEHGYTMIDRIHPSMDRGN